eukprot:3480490-Amphidinium_carterae.5
MAPHTPTVPADADKLANDGNPWPKSRREEDMCYTLGPRMREAPSPNLRMSRSEFRQRMNFVPEDAVMQTIRSLRDQGALSPVEEQAFLEPGEVSSTGADPSMPVGGWENEHQDELRFEHDSAARD